MCDHHPSPSRVAHRYLSGSRDLLSPQGMKLLGRMAKGTKGMVGMETVQEIMDALDGWSLEQGVGAHKLNGILQSDRLGVLLHPILGLDNPRHPRSSWMVSPQEKKEPAQLWFETDAIADKAHGDLVRGTESCGPKGPTNPQAGKLYAWKIEKPQPPRWGGGRFAAIVPVGQFRVGVPGWKLTAPNGKSVQLLLPMDDRAELAPPGNTKMPRLFTFGYKNGLQEAAQDLLAQMGEEGAEAVLPKSQRTRENTGTCPVCFGNYKLKYGKMVLHGYTRPPSWGGGRSYGPHHGECFGVGYPPYELSAEGCQAYLDKALKPSLKKARGYLRDLQSGKITQLEVQERRRGRNMETIGPDDDRWDQALDTALWHAKRSVDGLEVEIDRFGKLIKSWSPSPLPGEPGWRRPAPAHN